MATDENNFYKDDLEDARRIIGEERDKLRGDVSMGQSVRNKIVNQDGWVCDAADDWITDFTGQCTAVMGDFDAAYDEVDAAYGAEPNRVPEGDSRGLAYQNRYTHRGPGGPI